MCIKPAVLKNIYVPNVELNGRKLELVRREKYLCFFVSDCFYDDDYMNNEIGNAYARGNTIIRHCVYHKTVLDKLPVACNKVF